MTRKQFDTRKAAVAILQPQQANVNTPVASELQFSTKCRGSRLLVKPTACGVAALGQHRIAHPAFCSVTASTSNRTLEPSASISNGLEKRAVGEDCSYRQHGDNAHLERLPVAIKKGDQLLPYVWDGQCISAMDEAALRDSDMTTGRIRNWVLGLQRQLHQAFLPDPRDVTHDYWEWLRWRLTQRFFSSMMQNFSFSALLMATGLGAKKAFAASAAINWLLKDGVSRIVRMSVATSFGQTFDADLKRMRFITSLIFTACMAGEFATPFWPQHFVALASISSVGRAVGLSAFVAVQPAFQAALATGGNLADLTSKNQAQHMVMDMCALGVSAGLTWLLRSAPRGGLMLPAVMYPICAAGDLTSIWHELKAVQLRSLNRERAEMVIERWLRRGVVPSAAEISVAESLILPSDVCGGLLPLRITPLHRLAPHDPAAVRQLLQQYDGEQYILHVTGRTRGEPVAATAGSVCGGASGGGGGWRRLFPGSDQPQLLVSLSDRAGPDDVAKALLHAAYLRQAVLEHCSDVSCSSTSLHNEHTLKDHHHHHHHHRHHHKHQHRHSEDLLQQQPDAASLHSSDAGSSSCSSGSGNSSSSSCSSNTTSNGSGGESHRSHHHHHRKHHHQDPPQIQPAPGPLAVVNQNPGGLRVGEDGGGGTSPWFGVCCNGSSSSSATSTKPTITATSISSGSCGDLLSGCPPGPHGESHPSPHADPPPPPPSHGHVLSPSPPPPDPGELVRRLDEATWGAMMSESRRQADRNLHGLLKQAEQAGWKLKPFMLNTTERVTFVRL